MLFKKKVLATSVALAFAGTVAPAFAQTDDQIEDVDQIEIEEVIVLGGIRGSLKRSMDIKRDSAGVVDAISAEDMGKFPDANLAESLQRITGVSISRQRGEGSAVTVRGFGPEYNLVTLNGRQMPTHSASSRSFDFGDLASEGIAGVQVYKTGRADVPTGGVGSSINISTTRPLDAPGQKLSLTAKMVNDTSTRDGDEITPEFSGIYSNTFANDTIGIAITGSSQTRNNGVNAAETSGWFTRAGDFAGSGGVPDDANQVNRSQSADEFYSVPRNIAYSISEFETVRTNGQVILQWAPTDTVTGTIDYIYSEFDLDRKMSDLSAWFNNSAAASQASTWNDGDQRSPLIYSETHNYDDFAMGIHEDGRKNTNESVGLNLEWQATDRLSLALDYHDSSAETGANSPYGTSSLVTIASYNKVASAVYYGQELPIFEQSLNSGADGADRPMYKNDMLVTGSVFGNDEARMDIEQAKFSGVFEVSDTLSIDFGIQMTEVNNRFTSRTVQLDNWNSNLTKPGDLSAMIERSSMAGQFDQISGGSDPRQQTEYFTADIADVISVAEASYTASGNAYAQVGDCGTGYCASTNWNSDKRTTEETTAAYLQLNHATEFVGKPVNIQVGVRYEETDVTSASLAPTYSDVYWLGGNEFTLIEALDTDGNSIQGFDAYTGEYDMVLPSLDYDIEVAKNVVLRASYSKTVTRPSFTDIQGGITVDGTSFKSDGAFAAGGNPGLVPIKSTNYDVSVEWYYDEGSYLSIGYFEKDVVNFIGTSSRQDNLFNLSTPLNGTLFNQAVADSGLDPLKYSDVGAYIFANFSDNAAVQGDRIYGVEGDPLVPFKVRGPSNQETAKVDGVEINLQHNFGETGFGMIANATFVNADVSYDNMKIDSQFVLNGLSDSANLVAFYDKGGLQARLAYNWRDDYLAGVGQGAGTLSNPTNVESYGQLDFSASYDYNDNLTIFVAGLNILEETYNVYGRDKLQVLQVGQTGARYDIGVRYSF